MTADLTRLQAAVRSLSVLVSFEIVMDFVSPAMWVLSEQTSVLSNVARLSSSPTALALCWLLAALLVVPFVLMEVFWRGCKHRRSVIKLATYGMILGAVIWVFMAFLTRNLDYRFAVWNFLFNGAGSLAMGALMANGLNNDQIEIVRHSQRGEL